MKFLNPILILATAYLIQRSGLVKIDKCGLRGQKFKMALDNGSADVFFLSGKNGTCVAGVMNLLPFEDAKVSCNKLFSGGKMMSDENFDGLQSKINAAGFEMYSSYMMVGMECGFVDSSMGVLSKKACSSTTYKYNYLCQYPMQYNCAWQNEYIEMVTQSDKKFVTNHTVFSYDNEIGSNKGCPLIMDGSLHCTSYGVMFDVSTTDWSSCSESCTDPTNPPPTQSMKREVRLDCFKETKDAKEVFLHTKRSCNGHVLCPPAATVKPSSPDKPLSTDKDSLQPDSSMLPIIFGSIGGILLVFIIAVVFVCCYRWRRKRDNLPSGDGSSKRRSKRRSSFSSQAPEQSKKRRSRSPSPSTGQKSDVGSKHESPIRGRKGDAASRHESPIRGGRKGDAASESPIRGGRKGGAASGSPIRGGRKGAGASESPIRGGRKGDAASGSPIRGGRKGAGASGSPIRGGRKGDAASRSPIRGGRKGDAASSHGSVASVDSNIVTDSGVYKRYGREFIQNRVSAGAASTPKQDLSLPAKVDSV